MLGLESQIAGFAAVTDAAFYAGAGVTPLIFGGSGGAPHAEDEHVNVASLLPTARVYAGAVLQWCGVAGAVQNFRKREVTGFLAPP